MRMPGSTISEQMSSKLPTKLPKVGANPSGGASIVVGSLSLKRARTDDLNENILPLGNEEKGGNVVKKAFIRKPSGSATTSSTTTATATARSTRSTVASSGKINTAPHVAKVPLKSRTATSSKPPLKSTAKSTTVAPSKPKPSTMAAKSKPSTLTTATTSAMLPPPAKKKRKEYDVKGRLQDLEEQHTYTTSQLQESNKLIETMTDKLDMSQSTISELMQFKFTLESTVQAKEHEKSMIEQELQNIASVKEELVKSHETEIKLLKAEQQAVVEKMSSDMESVRKELDALKLELDGSRAESAQYKITISTQSANQYVLESEITLLKSKLSASEGLAADRAIEIGELEASKSSLEDQVLDLESQIRDHESTRRSLHNTIQELKGNIRVFCRMRPLLAHEQDDTTESGLSQIKFPPENEQGIELVQLADSASGKQLSKPYNFSFDKVFQPTSDQAVVFEEISQLVQSALDGYNVCIFAYGQTGSGKTFTMEGPSKVDGPEDANAGMIPRAVQQIYAACEALKEKGWEYDMQAQFLEIYNETLRDLLDDGGSDGKKMDIKHDAKNRTTVTDAINVNVTSPDEVFSLLARASQNRAVAATNCNERSSRSHSVFTLKLTGTNSLTQETCYGVLNLIDLAGSERLSSSGSTGDRLKETQAINKSLSSLGDVISALANKDAHIPYRNSKLTYLLQHSLGGNSKTLMFVNVSPLASSFNETLCSLRFATKVNSCQIGTARKQIKL